VPVIPESADLTAIIKIAIGMG